MINSNKFSNTVFYDPILEDDAVKREQYFSNMFKLFQDVDLIFFDPDNGLEIKSKSLGQKDSSKYLYWSEVIKSFEMGHSILMYQHFIRKNRDDFIASILQEIHIKTGSKCIISFRTSNVVFFLVSQEKQNEYFLNKARIVSKSWDKQIQVSPRTYP